jgi:hypothetical protein
MPRGNRNTSLAVRLANIQPRGIIPPEKIPGTKTWRYLREMDGLTVKYNAKKAQESFFANYSVEERAAYAKLIPHTVPMGLESNNESLIDDINRWVDGNGWQYIDGGEYNGSWVNPRYPNRIFVGTSRTLPIRGGVSETVVFPVASNDEDPIGLACHFEVSNIGTRSNILPNKWTNYDSTRKGRLQTRANASSIRRKKRWEEYQTAGKIKDPMKRQFAIQALKAQFLSKDIRKEQAEMGYDSDNDYNNGRDYNSDHVIHDDL